MYRVITGSISLRRVALVLIEHALIVLAVVVAAVIRLGFPETLDTYTHWLTRAVVVGAVLQVCLHYGDLYDLRTLSDHRDLLIGLLRALAAFAALALVRAGLGVLADSAGFDAGAAARRSLRCRSGRRRRSPRT